MLTSQAIFYEELRKDLGLTTKVKENEANIIEEIDPKIGGVVE
jgi:hypothetical protein